jgi:hypothetical protein
MASTYLSRTLGTATNRKKFTISLWFKKSSNSGHQYFLGTGVDGNNNDAFSIHSTIQSLKIGGYESSTTYELKTNASLRDNSAWYNAVVSFDSTQSTDTNRLKMYINGEQVTSFATAVYPSLNYEPLINKNTAHNIGADYNASGFFDGSISHFHFIDGTAYDASAFGSTDSTTGEWKINTSPSVTYGNNGFFWLKDNIATTDNSPNSNTFTVGAGTLTKTEDCPSNVFATWNPLDNFYANATFSNGNNTVVTNASAYATSLSTLGMSSGKYYCEIKAVQIYNGLARFGISGSQASNSGFGNASDEYVFMANSGQKRNNSTTSTYSGVSWNNNDIIGIAVDLDNNYIYFSRNGSWINSGNPASGASGTNAAFSLGTPSTGFYYFGVNDADNAGSSANTYQANFGNGYFGTTAQSKETNYKEIF